MKETKILDSYRASDDHDRLLLFLQHRKLRPDLTQQSPIIGNGPQHSGEPQSTNIFRGALRRAVKWSWK